MIQKKPGQQVRNLVIDLFAIARGRQWIGAAENLSCIACGSRYPKHKPRCIFVRTTHYLEETS